MLFRSVDVEFVAQWLMLRHGPEAPELFSTNTTEALKRLRDAGRLAPEAAETLLPAMRLYQGLVQTLRLAHDGRFVPAEAPRRMLDLLARVGEMPDFGTLSAHLVETEKNVREIFAKLLGKPPRKNSGKQAV